MAFELAPDAAIVQAVAAAVKKTAAVESKVAAIHTFCPPTNQYVLPNTDHSSTDVSFSSAKRSLRENSFDCYFLDASLSSVQSTIRAEGNPPTIKNTKTAFSIAAFIEVAHTNLKVRPQCPSSLCLSPSPLYKINKLIGLRVFKMKHTSSYFPLGSLPAILQAVI